MLQQLPICLKVFLIINQTPRHDVWRIGGIAPLMLNLETSGRCTVVAFAPGENTRYSLDRRVGGPWSRPESCGANNLLSFPGIELLFRDYPACSLVAILAKLSCAHLLNSKVANF
jgi:hypothetical protein